MDCVTTEILLKALTFAVDAPFSYLHKDELYSRSVEKAAKTIHSKAAASHMQCLCYLSKLLTLQILVGHLPSTGPAAGNNSCATRVMPILLHSKWPNSFLSDSKSTRGKDKLFGFLSQGHADCMLINSVSSVHRVTFNSGSSVWLDLASGVAKHLITS